MMFNVALQFRVDAELEVINVNRAFPRAIWQAIIHLEQETRH